MRRVIYILFLLSAVMVEAMAQKSFELPVWQAGECGDTDSGDARLYCYLPEVANGKAIIICPGGGYKYLAMDHEGHQFAPLLNKEGMAVFVLKYRMPEGRYEVPFADAAQAMRIVRAHAKEWGIKKVGIMGSSAGGHLATTLATHYTDTITRPDFQVLLYPVVTMNEKYTHKGSRDNLLGKEQTQELVDKYSNELHV
ncbi:MAG: alpha/beta hydrolase, partial [Bacteroidaceae bacterium]